MPQDALSNDELIVIRPQRMALPQDIQLDLDGYHTRDMLARPQIPLQFGHVPPEAMLAFFTPYAGHDQVKLKDDDRIFLHGPLKAFAPSMQQTANFLFSRNPEQFYASELTTNTVMADIKAGDSGHVPRAHIDVQIERFLAGKTRASTNCVYATAIPTEHFPDANKALASALNEFEQDDCGFERSHMLDELGQAVMGKKPLTYKAGDLVAHSDCSVHRSGRAEVDTNRMFQAAVTRPDNDSNPAAREKLVQRIQTAGYSFKV